MNNKTSPIKHFFIISGGTFLNLLIGLFTTPIITRLVNPTEYGQLSIFNMYTGIALLVFCLGLDQSLVRFYYKKDSKSYHRKLLRYCLMFPCIAWIALGSLFLILVKFDIVQFEFDTFVTGCMVICVLFQIINRIGLLLTRVEYHSGKYTIINIIHKILYTSLVVFLIIFYRFNNLYILVLSTTVSYIICVIVCIIFEKDIWFGKVNRKEDLIEFKQLIKFGLPFIISMGLTTIFQGIDKISLNYYRSYYEVGIYSSAMSIINIFAILQSSFNALWAPIATEHFEKNKDDKIFFQKGNAYITILMFIAGLFLILFKDIFAFLLGEKYRQAAYIIPCLCFNPIMYTISESTVNGINFAQKSHLHIWIGVISCITNIIGNTILVPKLGCEGAAISTGISYIVFLAMRTYFSNKCFYVDFKIKRLILLTFLVFIFAVYNTFVKFNILTVIGFLICLIMLFILYRNEIKEGISIFKSKLNIFINTGKEKKC